MIWYDTKQYMNLPERIGALFHKAPENQKRIQEILEHSEVRINIHGRPFPVKFYMNPGGYTRSDCRVCHDTAIWRIEIYNHVYEPNGSEYYCKEHVVAQADDRGE